MVDAVFGTLEFDGGSYWNGQLELDFFGEKQPAALMVDSCYESQTEISDRQRETLRVFLERWPDLQESVVREIVRYYNEEERFSYGPEDPEEFAAWWPEIETVEEMLKWVTLEAVVIESDRITESCREGGRCLYLLFGRKWAEDPDDNGVGIRLVNEAIDEIGFKDMAF